MADVSAAPPGGAGWDGWAGPGAAGAVRGCGRAPAGGERVASRRCLSPQDLKRFLYKKLPR